MGTFQGLELSKRALFAQQGALYTTGHNIANVNTDGYSRQRVNFETTTPFPVPSRVMPQYPGQVGTGVDIGTVERIRNKFLDMQFRSENSRHEYWNTKQTELSRLENLLNEPSSSGLSNTMDQFWQSLQDLATNPENGGARSVVAQRGLAVAETFNHISKSIQAIQGDLKEQIDGSVQDDNVLLRNINNLNEQIQKIEPHGMLANDLYDERDRLIDQLSGYMNIKVTYTPSSDSSLKIADGLASIEVIDSSGKSYDPPIYLIDARDKDNLIVNELAVDYSSADATKGLLSEIKVNGVDVTANLMKSDGSFNALIESYGWVNGGTNNIYPEMLKQLNNMAAEFAKAFNEQHEKGSDIEGNTGTKEFFVANDGQGITAESITVSQEILDNPGKIAAGEVGAGSRNGNNALELAKVFDKDLGPELDNTSVRKFYTALIGELGVNGQKAKTMKHSTDILRSEE